MAQDLRYREYAPIGALRQHVQSLWALRGPCDEVTPQLVVPDGCMSLVLNFAEPFEQRAAAGAFVRQPMIQVSGELRRPVEVQGQGRVELLGVRFWPGAIGAFLDVPVTEIVDGTTDESALGAPLAHELSRTEHGAEPADRVRLVQSALARALRTVAECDGVVRAAASALVRAEGCARIDGLAAALGISRRCVERRFAAEVGVWASPELVDTRFMLRSNDWRRSFHVLLAT
jgi:hypothetical protein